MNDIAIKCMAENGICIPIPRETTMNEVGIKCMGDNEVCVPILVKNYEDEVEKRMTIDEAIEFSKCKSTKQYKEIEDYNYDSKEHGQIADWLEELKAIKELDLEIPQHFTKSQSNWIKSYVILKKKEARDEAIDEYYKEMHDIIEGNEEFIDWQKYEIFQCNDLVKEQLKEQK